MRFILISIFFIFSCLNAYAQATENSIYMEQPDFLGVWTDQTYTHERVLKIQNVVIPDSEYNYAIKMKMKSIGSKRKNTYYLSYIGKRKDNCLEVLSKTGKQNKLYILKNGLLTDNNSYFMQKIQ